MGGKKYCVDPEEKLSMHSKFRIIKGLIEEIVFVMDLKEWEGQVNGEWHGGIKIHVFWEEQVVQLRWSPGLCCVIVMNTVGRIVWSKNMKGFAYLIKPGVGLHFLGDQLANAEWILNKLMKDHFFFYFGKGEWYHASSALERLIWQLGIQWIGSVRLKAYRSVRVVRNRLSER